MRVHWATDYRGDGNSFGYSVHNDEARRALVGAGATLDPAAPVAVHVAPAHRFRPVPGRLNVLYTAWESSDLTPPVRNGLARADAVAVTARFLVGPFALAAPGVPVEYCPLGVRHGDFPFVTRSPPARGAPFRFLWLGAPNARKGWEIVREAWRGFSRLRVMGAAVPAAELYVKTSVTDRMEEIPVPGARVVFDSRRLARPELARLYQDSHCFLFPSFGEGFGLTMAEALATGLPAIFTPWSATADLADEQSGYPLRYRLVTHDLAGDGTAPVTFAQADAADLLMRMLEVMADYPRALRKGRLAARRVRKSFAWDRTGKALGSIIRSACARRGVPTD